MRTLLGEWLADAGHDVKTYDSLASAGNLAPLGVAAVIVDVPNLRMQQQFPFDPLVPVALAGVPMIGLSTQLKREPMAASPIARSLGLVRLLPKPCRRVQLLAALDAALSGH